MKYTVLIKPYLKEKSRFHTVQVTMDAKDEEEAGKKAIEHIKWAHDGFDLVVQSVNEHTTDSKDEK